MSETPTGQAPGHLSAALKKLRRPLLRFSMMFYIFINYLPSHTVSHCASKIPVFPELARPKPFLDPRKLSKQLPGTYTLYYPNHLPNRIFRWKRYQYMHMICRYFHLLYFHSIFFAYFSNQLFRSFLYLFIFKYLLPIFWTPYQMICCIIDRMTRPPHSHTFCYTTSRLGLCGLGSLPVSLITLWAMHAFIPEASHGVFSKGVS